MTFSDVVERFSKTTPLVRGGGLAAVAVIFGGVYYYVFYSGLAEQSDRLMGQTSKLMAEKVSYEEKKQKYMAFRAEVSQLLEERKELVKVLPTEAEIPSFLQSIHAQAELSGLNILTFVQLSEVNKGFYATIPVQMSITGTYHQINKFFYAVGNLKRIVNIHDVQLSSPVTTESGIVLKASFIASTFRFLDKKDTSSNIIQKRRG